MRLDDYAQKDGKRVWLTVNELERLIDQTQNSQQGIALTLLGKAGLRRGEVVQVTRNDFTHAPDGYVRVWEDYSKSDEYREVPVPDSFERYVDGWTEGRPPDEPVVDVNGTTVYRWVRKAADKCAGEDGDTRGWSEVGPHDLRRSWGGHLLWNCGVSPMSVMEFGGWSDWQTFEEHYMGEMTPEARDRERSKIDYLGGEPRREEQPMQPATPATRQTYSGD